MTRPVGTGPRRRPRTTALSALAVGLLVPLALAGCTPDGGASTADPDAVTTTRTDDASEDPGDAGTAGSRGDSTAEPDAVSLPAGPVTVEIAAPPLASTASGESAPAVAVAAGDEGASDVALVLADAPALVSVEDGSLVRHADPTSGRQGSRFHVVLSGAPTAWHTSWSCIVGVSTSGSAATSCAHTSSWPACPAARAHAVG